MPASQQDTQQSDYQNSDQASDISTNMRLQEHNKILERLNMGHLSQKLRDTINLGLLIDDIDYVFPGAPNEASDDIKNT